MIRATGPAGAAPAESAQGAAARQTGGRRADRAGRADYPPAMLNAEKPFDRLVEVMTRLRQPGGCPWDAEQTHESLLRYLIEETYEVVDTIEAGEVDGVVTDLVGNQGYADENGGAKVIESYATDEFYGFAVQEEGSEALLEAVNASLAKFQDDGTYDSIYGDWFPGA